MPPTPSQPDRAHHQTQTDRILTTTSTIKHLGQQTLSYTWTIPRLPTPPKARKVEYANPSEGSTLTATKPQPLNTIRYAYHRWKFVHSTAMLRLRNELDRIRIGFIGDVVTELIQREMNRRLGSLTAGNVNRPTSRIDFDALEKVVEGYVEIVKWIQMRLETAVDESRADPKKSRELLREAGEDFIGWGDDLKGCDRDLRIVADGVEVTDVDESALVDSAVQLVDEYDSWEARKRRDGYDIWEYFDDIDTGEANQTVGYPETDCRTEAITATASSRARATHRETQVRFDAQPQVREFDARRSSPFSPFPEALRLGGVVGLRGSAVSLDPESRHLRSAVGYKHAMGASRTTAEHDGRATRSSSVNTNDENHAVSHAMRPLDAASERAAVNAVDRVPGYRIFVPAISFSLDGSRLWQRRAGRRQGVPE